MYPGRFSHSPPFFSVPCDIDRGTRRDNFCLRHTCDKSGGQTRRIAHIGPSSPVTIATRSILCHSPSCKCCLAARQKKGGETNARGLLFFYSKERAKDNTASGRSMEFSVCRPTHNERESVPGVLALLPIARQRTRIVIVLHRCKISPRCDVDAGCSRTE